MSDPIIKLYAEKLVKDVMAQQGVKLSYVKREEFDKAVRQVIEADQGIKDKAYGWFNGPHKNVI